jgi:hypothetical protein
MAYYIYETWKSGLHKTVIHDGACVYCNDGEGTASDDAPAHAEWHGPFKTLTEAINKSKKMKNVVEHKECGRCMKFNN